MGNKHLKKKKYQQGADNGFTCSTSAISPSVDMRVWLWVTAPLFLFGFMLNVRLFPMISPNEEPKWALLVLCGVWMAVAGVWVLWRRPESAIIYCTWAGLALFLFYSLLGVGVFITPNMTEGLIRFSFWLSCLGVFLTSCWAWRNILTFQEIWAWFITLGSFVFCFRYWQGYALDYGAPNYNIHVLFSPIGHVNFTGDVLVVLLPVLIYLLLTQKHVVLRILNWFSISTSLAVLLIASSRGALGGMALGLLVLLFLLLKHRKFMMSHISQNSSWYFPAVLLFSSFFTSIAVYETLPYHYRDLVRVSGAVESAAAIAFKPVITPGVAQPPMADIWNALMPVLGARTPMYASATAMLMDAPLLGHGTGSFFAVYPAFSNKFPDFRDPLSNERTFTTNPHNVVLQIATQQGLIATMLFMGLLLYLWGRLLLAVWVRWDAWQVSGLVAVTAALFDAMFNHVFFNPASMFVFALFSGCWWAALKTEPTIIQIPALPARVLKPVMVVMIALLVLLSLWPARWAVSEWYAGSAMSHMRQPALAGEEYQQSYLWDKDNFRAVFGVAQMAYQQKHYDEAILYLQHFEVIFPYNLPALNLLGAAYLMQGNYAKSIGAFQRALAVSPDFKMAQVNLTKVQRLLNEATMRLNKATTFGLPKR